MAVYTVTNSPFSSIMGGYAVGSLEWHHGAATITKIEAKVASGSATFNARIADRGDALGWAVKSDALEDIEAGYSWHFRADDFGCVPSAADGDEIAIWYSYLGELSSFRQVTSGNRALYKTALGPNDNTATLLFDGSDNYYSQYQAGSGEFSITGKTFSAFAVIGDHTETNNAPIIGTRDSGDSSWNAWWGMKGRKWIIRGIDSGGGGDQYIEDGSAAFLDADQIRSFVYEKDPNNSASEWVNGTSVYDKEPLDTGSSTFNFNTIGSTEKDNRERYLEAGISELILFSTDLGTDARELVEGYLAHRWGLTGNLPVGHTYKSTNPYSGDSGPSSEFINTLQHIELGTSYATCFSGSQSIQNGKTISWYMPNAQKPGDLTVSITYTVP